LAPGEKQHEYGEKLKRPKRPKKSEVERRWCRKIREHRLSTAHYKKPGDPKKIGETADPKGPRKIREPVPTQGRITFGARWLKGGTGEKHESTSYGGAEGWGGETHLLQAVTLRSARRAKGIVPHREVHVRDSAALKTRGTKWEGNRGKDPGIRFAIPQGKSRRPSSLPSKEGIRSEVGGEAKNQLENSTRLSLAVPEA